MLHRFEETLQRFDVELPRALSEEGRWGYFLCLYRAVTLKVSREVAEGRFDDGLRMERMVSHFAWLYFHALDLWRGGGRPASPWAVAFAATEERGHLVLQHLLLGMNAHILYDLPVSAAYAANGSPMAELARDFETINEILMGLVDGFEDQLAPHTPGLGPLDRLLGRWDEGFADLSMRRARAGAWEAACRLAESDPAQRSDLLASMERSAGLVARGLAIDPPGTRFDHWLEPREGPRAVMEDLLSVSDGW